MTWLMMTFQVRLKMARKPNQPRLRFDLEKLRNPDVACTFQATIGAKFAPLVGLSDEDMVGWLGVLLFNVHGKHLRSCRDGQLT